MSLEDVLIDRIRNNGPMSIAEYMVIALTHPDYGYYMRKDPFGVQGDFITAPEISQVFGELIGAWLAMQWIIIGKPQAALVEIGPGRGTLMSDILRATKGIKGFHDAITVHMMELSPVLRKMQWDAVGEKHPHVHWHTGFGEIPAKPILLVANEFFDALPIRQFMHTREGWLERMITVNAEGKLDFIYQPQEPPPVLEDAPVSKKIYEYSEASTQMMLAIANRVFTQGGAALIVDYGHDGHTHGDTFQALRDHKFHDVLVEPGTADLTAHVDFYRLTQAAAIGGANVYGPVGQGEFLKKLGVEERIEELCKIATKEQKKNLLSGLARLTAAAHMGTLFKALCLVHPSMPKPEGF